MSDIAIIHFVNYKRGTQSRAAMRGVMHYVMQEMKTTWEGGPLISGINCQPQSVYDDFLNTKLLYHKDGGVMFYHMVQSFPKGAAVDPRQAHEAARRLAEYFDGCEVLVCTHVDREHIHSHCVINSVNFETGKKLHMAKEQIQELMRRNDMICQEMGLPVFETPIQKARGMGGAEYHTALKGQSWKLRLMNTIDECMKYAADRDAFVSLMASEGYAVRWESGRKYIKYETYFKLIIATGMRRGECCGLKWCDIDWEQRSIHICRNAVKVTDEEIFVKEPKTRAGDRYVYFSAEMESLLREYQKECRYITETYDQRQLTADDFLFRRQGAQLPMTPTTFTYRFKLILKKNGLPQELNVHSLRHTAASLMIAGGTDVATVAGILGHSQPSTTLDIYTHAFDKNKKAASAGLQGMLEI